MGSHQCATHSKWKAFAQRSGKPDPVTSVTCDETKNQSSIVVHHKRGEERCQDGHFCYMRGDQCVCVQKYASSPDRDRCWLDLCQSDPNGEVSVKACYRLCHDEGDSSACDTVSTCNFQDTDAPTLFNCAAQSTSAGSPEAVSASGNWDLSKVRARDELDGWVTDDIRYNVGYIAPGDTPADIQYVCNDCTFGEAKHSFTTSIDQDPSVTLGVLKAGEWQVSVMVEDRAGNPATETLFVSI